MSKQISTSEFKRLLGDDIQWIDQQIEYFNGLSDDQMQHKPAPEKWSAYDCLAHASILYAVYIRNTQKALAKAEKRRLTPSQQFKSGPLGAYLTKSMAPASTEKVSNPMKTFKMFDPQISYRSKRTPIDNFVAYHDEFKKLYEQIPEQNLEKIKVKSSLGSIIMFRLGDCYRFITAHNKRHLVQALNAAKTWNG